MKIDRPKLDRSSWDEIQIDGWFKALMPPSWEIDDDDEVLIYDPAGFGDLRISLFRKSSGKGKKERAMDIITDWAEELDQRFNYEVAILKRTRSLMIMSVEFIGSEDDGDVVYWRVFAAVGDNISLDICYSCALEDRDRETDIVEGIIDSIKLLEPVAKVSRSASGG